MGSYMLLSNSETATAKQQTQKFQSTGPDKKKLILYDNVNSNFFLLMSEYPR